MSLASMQVFADTTTTVDAKVEANMAAQVTACNANTAMEWSSTLNRCVGKAAARAARNEAMACDALTTAEAKEACHLKIAEKSTGLSSDASKLNQGSTTGSMVMNGSIAAAYAIIALISDKAKSGLMSGCTSKTILAATSAAGIASDLYLKISAKKKIKELEDKYKLDKESTAYEAQIKALEYLKEEQETVVKIASLEKKRNMALMAGYGAAAAFAAYELAFPAQNTQCTGVSKNEGGAAEGQTEMTAQANPENLKVQAKVDVKASAGAPTK